MLTFFATNTPRVKRFVVSVHCAVFCISFLLVFQLGRAQGGSSSLILPGGEESLWENVVESYDTLYRTATPAVPIKRLIMPWEKSKAVALALPLGEFNENSELAQLFQETLAALLPRVEVIAYYNRLDRRLLGDFLGTLEMDTRIAPYLDKLVLESSDAFSIWMRDFGPQFAEGVDGSLVLLDPSIGDPGASRELLFDVKGTEDPVQQHFRMIEELAKLRGIDGNDRIPVLMSGLIEGRWGVRTRLSRPPLYLQGGDFLPLSEGVALVSASTLRVNGGMAQVFRKTMKDYYGIDEVVFLENLPGKTIEHLDFTVQPIREGVVLLADVPREINSDRAYHRRLDKELRARLSRSEAAVAKAMPSAKIVKVPMPPPALDSDADVRQELFLSALQQFVAQERIAMRVDVASALANWDSFKIDPRIEAKLLEMAKASSWKTPLGQEKVIERFLGTSFESLLSRHVEAQISYRSYVNSLYVKGADGREVVFLPRFLPLNAEEETLFPQLEREVVSAYQSACPDAELVWIDCSVLTDFLGVIHCYTLTVPDPSGWGTN